MSHQLIDPMHLIFFLKTLNFKQIGKSQFWKEILFIHLRNSLIDSLSNLQNTFTPKQYERRIYKNGGKTGHNYQYFLELNSLITILIVPNSTYSFNKLLKQIHTNLLNLKMY